MYERHLLRMDGNPLFSRPPVEFSGNDYIRARQQDNEELHSFHEEMRAVIQQAIELEDNVESEVILQLRATLDQLYARCSSFGGGCVEHKQNIRKLIDLVMKAVWQAAGNDPHAREELEKEEMARQQHFRLLEYPLIADLIRPDTPVEHKDLIPTLLCADRDELEATFWLFDQPHMQLLYDEAEQLLQQCREGQYNIAQAEGNLGMIHEHLNTMLSDKGE